MDKRVVQNSVQLLNYRFVGQGAPLLLIHGMGVTFTIWRELLPYLAPYYKLVMVELPGCGASPDPLRGQNYYQASADAVDTLRQSLGIEKWAVLSYSLGAWVGKAYLESYPDQVTQALFLCPARLHRAAVMSLRGLVLVDRFFPAFGNWLLSGWRLLRLVQTLGFNGKNHPYAAVWADEISAQPVTVIKAGLRDLPGLGGAQFALPSKPTCFIWGRQDIIAVPPKHLRAEDHVIQANHSAPMLAAAQVAEIIRQFLPPELTQAPG